MRKLFESILNGLLGLPPTAVYAVIGILAGVENVFPPVPADTAVAIGAFLSTGGIISAQAVFATTWIANVTSATMVYVAGRTVGRQFFRGRLGQRLLNPAAMARLELLYGKYGMWGIFFSRFLPGLRAVVPPFAGIANLGAWRTILPMVVASGLWYGTLTFVAATAIRELDQVARFVRGLNVAGAIAGGVVIVGAGLAIWWRWRKKLERTGAGTQQ